MKVQLIVLNVKQERTFKALGYHCQPFEQWRERNLHQDQRVIFSFCLESHFGVLSVSMYQNLIVKWDIAKNTSPLFEWEVVQDGGELHAED